MVPLFLYTSDVDFMMMLVFKHFSVVTTCFKHRGHTYLSNTHIWHQDRENTSSMHDQLVHSKRTIEFGGSLIFTHIRRGKTKKQYNVRQLGKRSIYY